MSAPLHSDRLERALAALPPAPPAPSIDATWAAIDAAAARRIPAPRRLAVAAAALVAVGAGIFAVLGRGGGANRDPWTGSIQVMNPSAVRVLRDGADVDPATIRAGDRVDAKAASRLTFGVGVRVEVRLDPDASIELAGPNEVVHRAGRARYDVAKCAEDPFVVRTDALRIEDVGTRFVVDCTPAAGGAAEREIVSVEDGLVVVTRGGAAAPAADVDASLRLKAGQGAAFVDGRATGPAWDLAARPRLTLESEDAAPRAGAPLVLRVTLENETDGWMPLPERDPVRAPLWIDVRAPDGVVTPVRVTEDRILPARGEPGGSGAGTAIPPRGRVALRVRFDRTFASPGTYRLQALYRAADAASPPVSPEIAVTVR